MISVIIPAYNAANCLSQCIDSILAQTYSDFEVIIVDDGSVDNTYQVCKEYVSRDSRVRCIRQDNAGVSVARNRGIDVAKGSWLAFVDADDTVDSRYLEDMFDSAIQYKSDLVFCGFSVSGTSLRKDDIAVLRECCGGAESGVVNSNQIIDRTICIDPAKMLYGYIWRNLFSAKLLSDHHIRFQNEFKISEDYQFILFCLIYSKTISIVAKPLYHYKVNDLSVTTKYMPTMHRDMNAINAWMYNNVVPFFPSTIKGFYSCVANTYLGEVQNLCRCGTPYSLLKRFSIAYSIKKRFKYNKALRRAIRQNCRPKARIAFLLFVIYFEWLYMFLFSLKEHSLFSRH